MSTTVKTFNSEQEIYDFISEKEGKGEVKLVKDGYDNLAECVGELQNIDRKLSKGYMDYHMKEDKDELARLFREEFRGRDPGKDRLVQDTLIFLTQQLGIDVKDLSLEAPEVEVLEDDEL
jgi:hypothetical protein